MSVSVLISDEFKRNAKKLLKKYRSLKEELNGLIGQLQENPRLGTKIGEDIYKIRLAVKSKGKGKSGGMRIITYVDVEVKQENEAITVILLTIYDKSDFENVSDEYLRSIVASTKVEEEE